MPPRFTNGRTHLLASEDLQAPIMHQASVLLSLFFFFWPNTYCCIGSKQQRLLLQLPVRDISHTFHFTFHHCHTNTSKQTYRHCRPRKLYLWISNMFWKKRNGIWIWSWVSNLSCHPHARKILQCRTAVLFSRLHNFSAMLIEMTQKTSLVFLHA